MNASVRSFQWKRGALLLSLFVAIFGARLWIVNYAGSVVPFWDQWDAEGMKLFKPFLRGELPWSRFFAPHNEHRIVLTRFLSLGSLRLNGMWDPRLEMAVNALIAAGTGTLIAHLLVVELGEAWLRTIVFAVALLWIVPFGWENTVMGLQSIIYFLVLFSFVAIWGLSYGPPYSRRWWIGWAAIVLACLSMASGFMAALAVAGVRGLAIVLDRKSWRTHWLTIALALTCAGITLFFARHKMPHDALYAHGPSDFLPFFSKCLSWPAMKIPLACLVLQLPVIVTAWNFIREKGGSPARSFVIALALWGIMEGGALAYARSGNGGYPPSRYEDLLALGFLGTFAALLLEWRRLNRWLRYAWVLVAAVGVTQSGSHALRRALPEVRQSRMEETRRCREYVVSGDMAILRNVSDPLDIPLGDATKLAACLNDPDVRSILLFVPGQENRAKWPSRISNWLLKCSPVIFAFGLLFGLVNLKSLRHPVT